MNGERFRSALRSIFALDAMDFTPVRRILRCIAKSSTCIGGLRVITANMVITVLRIIRWEIMVR